MDSSTAAEDRVRVGCKVGYYLVCGDTLADGVGDGRFCDFGGDEVWVAGVER